MTWLRHYSTAEGKLAGRNELTSRPHPPLLSVLPVAEATDHAYSGQVMGAHGIATLNLVPIINFPDQTITYRTLTKIT